ncbi:hypothetical protein HWV62_41250 [Athelia sp. TMB]|nr:hypothetical protein HWV62_41250 [Athelia sp. TMB]
MFITLCRSPRFASHICSRNVAQPVRTMATSFNGPAPPSLPRAQQREFEELLRSAQAPLSASSSKADAEAELALHPDARKPIKGDFEGDINPKTGEEDARKPIKGDFEGDINPKTGEEGGPKREPVRKWAEGDGDWSFKGRVTDF